jgi:hypothetical protein
MNVTRPAPAATSDGKCAPIGAKFSGGEVSFEQAKFSDGSVSFHLAEFSGGTVDFSRADDLSSRPEDAGVYGPPELVGVTARSK